jgi:FkbM family methyltransferase
MGTKSQGSLGGVEISKHASSWEAGAERAPKNRFQPAVSRDSDTKLTKLVNLARDCYQVFKAPTGSKAAILKGVLLPNGTRMGFRIAHFDRATLNFLFREIFARQPYYFRSDTETPVILDCGANLGMASLYLKWLYPKSRVQAFEADPATFRLLRGNMARNNLDVETHNCALWDRDGELDFFVDGSKPGSLVMSAVRSRSQGEPIKVQARKLSDFIQGPVDFLKLDVEGAEHRVLRELKESGKIGAIRQMVIEYHHKIGGEKSCLSGFLEMLEQAGFEYQIRATVNPLSSKGIFQDVLIGTYR